MFEFDVIFNTSLEDKTITAKGYCFRDELIEFFDDKGPVAVFQKSNICSIVRN